MRIISKKKDYFDSLQAQWHDPSIVYVRTHKEFEQLRHLDGKKSSPFVDATDDVVALASVITPLLDVSQSYTLNHGYALSWEPVLLVVAGTLHPVVRVSVNTRMGDADTAFAYSIEELMAFIAHYPALAERLSLSFDFNYLIKRLPEFYALHGSKVALAKCLEHRIAVAAWHVGRKLELNPLLKDFEFQRVLPPYEMSQELSMFLSNAGAKDNPMVTVSDAVRVQAHGFTDSSFRNTGGRMSDAKAKVKSKPSLRLVKNK